MTARRFVACLVVGFCASLAARADDAEIKKVAKERATECQNALLKGDYETFVGLTHPKVVEEIGGRKKMVELLTTEMKALKAQGVTFKSVKMSDPSDPISAGKELYISIPFTLEMTVPDGRLITKSAFIGISTDGGKTWAFLDASPGRDVVKKVLPDLPEKLPIPKKEQPTLIKD